MDIVTISAIIAILICVFLLFVEFTVDYFYFSAITDLFLFDHKKWRLYRRAKKKGVKHYLRPLDYEIDYENKEVPEFYLYPLVQEDGGIHYMLYTDNYEFITGNFHLTERL